MVVANLLNFMLKDPEPTQNRLVLERYIDLNLFFIALMLGLSVYITIHIMHTDMTDFRSNDKGFYDLL